MNDEKQKQAEAMTRMMNFRLHADCLNLPLLKGFEPKESDHPQVILLATGEGGFLQQIVSDGPLNKGETLENRIDLNLRNTEIFMQQHGELDPDNKTFFYKDMDNGSFKFKIYVNDSISLKDGERRLVRQFSAYFIEPKFNDFYQASVAVGPFTLNDSTIKLGVVDLENDEITKILNLMINGIVSHLTHR